MQPMDASWTVRYKMRGRPGVGGTRMSWWNQDGWVEQIFLDLVEGFLTIFYPLYLYIFPQQLEQWLASCSELCNEMGYVVDPSQEASDFFLCFWCRHTPYSLNLCRINFDSPATDNEAQ